MLRNRIDNSSGRSHGGSGSGSVNCSSVKVEAVETVELSLDETLAQSDGKSASSGPKVQSIEHMVVNDMPFRSRWAYKLRYFATKRFVFC